MCRNNQAAESNDHQPRTKFTLFLCMLCWLFCFLGSAHAAPVKVSLVLGDTPTKATIEAVKALYQEYPNLKKKVKFNLYSNFRKNLAPLGEANLILIHCSAFSWAH